LSDLIEAGLGPGDVPAVLLSGNEPADPLDAALHAGRWGLSEGAADAEVPPGATHAFIVLDGASDPVDQIEALKAWLEARGEAVARVLCVVDCALLAANPKLHAWYEACVHFSDVVLLNRREGVSNRWMSDFQGRFEEKFYPCLFELVRAGKVRNPPLVLSPEARRMSHVFDETEWVAADGGEEEDAEDGEEVEVVPVEDPYLERRNGGRRVLELPRIADFLPGPGGPKV
jgi:hypothetical protein